ncbi:MAG: hypothetical protein IC227_00050 [Enterococcus lacertideformus]|uniref:Uncharacterized protein n=1 Tax=Enterococcus lacertideformus TaxID=2771493 RepID=A0A931AY93_9ENTE|nr:hypothetical protein [Enterococcus lacertideformus]
MPKNRLEAFTDNVAYYLLARELVRSDPTNKKNIKELLGNYKKSYWSISLNILGIFLGFIVQPIAVLATNMVILLGWLIPSRKIETQYSD